jgi:hypothetical protein
MATVATSARTIRFPTNALQQSWEVAQHCDARNRAVAQLLGCLSMLRNAGCLQPSVVIRWLPTRAGHGDRSDAIVVVPLLPCRLLLDGTDVTRVPPSNQMERWLKGLFAKVSVLPATCGEIETLASQNGLREALAEASERVLHRSRLLPEGEPEAWGVRMDRPMVRGAFHKVWVPEVQEAFDGALTPPRSDPAWIAAADTYKKHLARVLAGWLEVVLRDVEQRFAKPVTEKKLRVFDFDDTLVKTDARVGVTTAAGQKFWLNPGEYAVYESRPGDTFDFSEFRGRLINPREIRWVGQILRKVFAKRGAQGAALLTARGDPQPIRTFLEALGLHNIEIAALESNDPQRKAQWLAQQIDRRQLTHVEFFDDSTKNVAAVQSLQSRFPHVKITARVVEHRASA